MSAICADNIKANFSSNRRCCTLSIRMVSIWPKQLHIWLIRYRNINKDNRRMPIGEIRMMQIILKLVGFLWMM